MANNKFIQIAEKLKDARKYLGLTEEVAAAHIGISKEKLLVIEEGEELIDKSIIVKLSQLYRHPISYFFGQESLNKNPTPLLARTGNDLSEIDRTQIERFSLVLIEMGKEFKK